MSGGPPDRGQWYKAAKTMDLRRSRRVCRVVGSRERRLTVRSFHSLAPPVGPALVERVNRLRHSLNDLGGQLIEGIADAVARGVADAVHDAVRALLTNARGEATLPDRDSLDGARGLPSSLGGGPDQADDPLWPDEQEPSTPVWDNPDEDRWPTCSNDRHLSVVPTHP